jgi:putative ABC transport system permease protein
METVINTIFLILSLAGSTIIFISIVLIANTMEAIMAQQIKQIGIMRLVGGTIAQVAGLYFIFITFLAVIAILFAIPLSSFVAHRFSTFLLNLNNFDMLYPNIPPWVYGFQVVVGLSITWLASLKPILSSTLFLTIREAISPVGTEASPSNGTLERLLTKITHFSGSALVAVRNIFRKKWRLMLTVVTLSFGGAAFIAVFCIRSSILKTVYSLHYEYNRYDITITFSRPYRQEILASLIKKNNYVSYSEGWATDTGLYILPNGDENKNDPLDVIGLPPESPLVKPTIIAGSWLTDENEGCIVVNKYFFEHLPWTHLGSEVRLNIGGREKTWRIIGEVYGGFNFNQNPAVYMSLKDYGKATNTSGKVNSLQIVLTPQSAKHIPQAASALENYFNQAGYYIKDLKTATEILFFIDERVAILTTVLLTLSFLLALVGGINLTNTMSTNVIERTREIGVMRAIGASSKILRQITVSEGLFIGWFSWLFACALSFPAGQAATQRIGMTFIGMPLFFSYSITGLGLWLLLVSFVAIIASLVPAQNAIQITIREAISYE